MSNPADTSLLIAFSGIARLDVLKSVFPRIVIPIAVLDELQNGYWHEARSVLHEIHSKTWLTVAEPPDIDFPIVPPAHLGAGELETLRLAIHTQTAALVDDNEACRFAKSIGVRVVRSLAILALAKKRGSITAVRPMVMGMIEHGIHLSKPLISRFLTELDEG